MSTPNKAYIKFKLDDADTDFIEIRFHSVIFEDHEVSNEITKFPVQSGFDISNHSIRKNRKISLSAMVSNTQMLNSAEFHEYSSQDNSRTMHDMLTVLVREAISCTVITNLDEYTPVIFKRFKTKQEAGMTDAMSFVLSGEEVQIASSVNKSSIAAVVFEPLKDSERAAKVEELRQAGLDVPEEATISTGKADLAVGFQLPTTLPTGAPAKMTYDPVAFDPSNSEHSFECSISPDGTVTDEESGATLIGGDLEASLLNGANVMGACLVEQGVGLATELVDEAVTTALGDLKKTIYGGLYEVLGVNGDRSFGQRLLGIGLDCFICGATAAYETDASGFATITEDDFDTDLPTVDDALEGAATHGDGLITDTLSQSSPTTITKISGSSAGTTSFLGDLL